jgi:uncharacterized protein YdiU (UPF0061 family)
MNLVRFVSITVLLLLSVGLRADTIQVDAEEFKRLAGDVADLRDANTALQQRITQLESRNEALQKALRESDERWVEKFGAVASRDDLSKMADKLREIDQKREADRKLILEQFEKLATTLSASAETVTPKTARKSEAKEPGFSKTFEGNVITYEIEPGDMLEKVIKKYNQRLDKDSRPHVTSEQVQAVNPGLNPNNLIAGRKLQLPVPDRK